MFELNTNNAIMYVAFAIQFTVFFFFVYLYRQKIMREMRVMKDLIADFKEMNRDDKSSEMLLKVKSLLDSRFSGDSFQSGITELWERYYKRAEKLDENEQIHVNPFLGADALYQHLSKRNWFDPVSGICVSLGVLGTFVGLVYGISNITLDIQTGAGTQGFNALTASIELMLDGMKTAFLTSILGVILSLWWIYIDKRNLHKFEAYCLELGECFDYLLSADEEQLILDRMKLILQEQATMFKTDLMDVMEKTMSPIFSQMTENIDRQTIIMQEQLDVTKENSSQMTDQLVSQTTKGMESAISSFMARMEMMGGFLSKMTDSMEAFQQTSKNSHQQSLVTVEKTEQMMQLFERVSGKMDNMHDGFTQISDLFSKLGDSLESMQQMNANAIPVQTEMTATIQNLSLKYDESMKAMSQFKSQVDDDFSEKVQQITEQTQQMSSRFELMTARLEKALQTQESTIGRSSALLADVDKIAGKMSPIATNFETIGQTLAKMQEQFLVMQASQRELAQALTSSREKTDQLTTQAMTTAKDYLDKMEQQISQMGQRSVIMQQQWTQTEQAFRSTNQNISSSLKTFEDSLEQVLSKSFKLYDEELTKAMSMLGDQVTTAKSLNEEFKEAFEDLLGYLEKKIGDKKL